MIAILKNGGATPVAIILLKHSLEVEQTDQSIFLYRLEVKPSGPGALFLLSLLFALSTSNFVISSCSMSFVS